jgi:hypothetical protein
VTHDQFKREKNYRIYLSIAKAMLADGVITEKEFKRIDMLLVNRYKPVIGGI